MELLAFYETDACIGPDISIGLAERLATFSDRPEFRAASLFLREDAREVGLWLSYDPARGGPRDWDDHPVIATMLESAAWLSCGADVRGYRRIEHVDGDGPAPTDLSTFVIVRYGARAASDDGARSELARRVADWTLRYAQGVAGFLAADVLESDDAACTVLISAWTREGALRGVERHPGALDALRAVDRMVERRVVHCYERLSHVRGRSRPAAGIAPSAVARPTPTRPARR